MKIFRLSLFNLKRNRREAAAILFLTLISSFLLGTFFSSVTNIPRVFDRSFGETGCRECLLMIDKAKYRDAYREILEEDYGITDIAQGGMLYALSTKIDGRDGAGDDIVMNLDFVTVSTEKKFESFVKSSELPENELEKLEHPIWLPEYFSISEGYVPGDTFTVISGGMKYPFTVAGIYKCGLLADTGRGRKLVISDYDYMLLSAVYPEKELLIFDRSESFDFGEYSEKCSERTSENFSKACSERTVEEERFNETTFLLILLYICAFISGVTIAAVIFLIGHKITKDIEDQMQQIGVLEALGYRSREISLSYVCEYILSGGTGALLGGIGALCFVPVMNGLCTSIVYRSFEGFPSLMHIIAAVLLVAFLAVGFAVVKAGAIKRIPPVTAFRKGIKSHHFGKNVFPLERLRKSVNFRLAMKGIFTDVGSNIGACVCMILAGTAMMFSAFTYDFFSGGGKAFLSFAGMEASDELISLMNGVDAEAFREELLAMPEVRKVNLSFGVNSWMYAKGSSEPGTVFAYEDYRETENIHVSEGRYPEFENEIMITLYRAEKENRHVGDSIVITGDGGEKSYIITGIVPSTANSKMSFYTTSEGYIRLEPNARPNVAEVYLNEGEDRTAFEKKLTALYGANVKDTAYSGAGGGTLDERIKAAADDKMATLIAQYGVTDVDYAVKIGDRVIKGNSSKFVIKEMTSIVVEFETEMKEYSGVISFFCASSVVFVGVIVAVILGIISASSVKRQRRSLGIMKSMGYTSKDLMIQIALRILPAAVISSVAAVFCTFAVQKAFYITVFGIIMPVKLPLVIASAAALVVFCVAVSYVSARRIKKISVTELVTE